MLRRRMLNMLSSSLYMAVVLSGVLGSLSFAAVTPADPTRTPSASSSGDRVINVLQYVFMHEAEEKNITREQVEEVLSRARPCLEVTMEEVDRTALSDVLGVLEKTLECLRVVETSVRQPCKEDPNYFLNCFKTLPDIPTKSLDLVDAAVDSCVHNPDLRLKNIVASEGR